MIYRAKVVQGYYNGSCKVVVPQIYGDTNITVTRFSSGVPLEPGFGWVSFESNEHSFPIWLGYEGSVPQADVTGEPIGHEDRSKSQMFFDRTTRTFTISPVAGSHVVWCAGREYVKATPESVTLPNTTGFYFIYYNQFGILSYSTTVFSLEYDAPTSFVYWNAEDGTEYFFADERHGIVMDWATHQYLHRTRGSAYASGFALSNYTTSGSGSSNNDAKFDLSNGVFFDEDIDVSITHSATPVANTWEQHLQGPARIPIVYRSGSHWKKDTATDYPLKNAYTGSSLAQYNLNTAGVWSTPALTNNKFGVTWVAATNNLNEPVIGVLGQAAYNNIGDADAALWGGLDLTGFPSYEFRPIWKIIYQTATGYTNVPKSRIVAVTDLRKSDLVTGLGSTAISTNPQSAVFTVPGTLNTGTGLGRYYVYGNYTISDVVASVGTAPTGTPIIVDVNKNGTTIFTTQANRPTIDVGTFVDSSSVPDVVALANGDYLTVDVDQKGSTIAGTDLVVQIFYA